MKKRQLKRGLKTGLALMLMLSWTLASWPRLPGINFPPKVDKAEAVPEVVILTIAETSPWDVPSDWNDTNTIEVIGGGAGGGGGGSGGSQGVGGGGGGGAYSIISDLDLTPDGTANFQIGTAGGGGAGASNGTIGGDTWFNGSGTTCSGQSICGEGGDGGASNANGGGGGPGGTDTNSIGTAKSGGTGADAGASTGGGGGGAAGDTAVGSPGSGDTGGDGGGSGTAGGGLKNNAGTDGAEWITAGSGGGGGGGDKANGGAGGADGAGGGGGDNAKIGGTGTGGVIVITYEPVLTTYLTQNDFELFVDNDVLTPTDAWPSGARNLDEGIALTALPVANDPIDPNDEIRIRMNIAVTTAELAASAEGFILQFAKADDCTAGPSWTDVGSGDWGFATSSVSNNTTLTSTVIDTSSVLGRYNNADPSSTNPNAVPSGQAVEWDWHVVYNGSAGANTYCFRMRKDDPADLDAYENDGYPKISTRPAVGDQMRHGEFFSSDAEQGFFWTE